MSGSAERFAAAALLIFTAAGARADVFSPGPLAKAHENLEGLSNCTKCHVAGSKLSNDTCLACHKEITPQIEERRGFHGKIAPAELSCNRCHHEHQGRNAPLTWGPGGQKAFDHAKTGFALKGKHAPLDCAQCHTDKLIADAAVRASRAKEPGRATFLGLSAKCSTCHFDEHRGQLGNDCAKCHNESAWKPAPGFNHARTDFALQGKHTSVECLKCHARVADADAHKGSKLAPKAADFARFKPVTHGSCADCHKDPHEGRLGVNCASCHTVNGWMEVKTPASTGARAFHDKTRYPLRGAHEEVACKTCHGPWKGQKAIFKGLKFANCSDCHIDAHLGQVGTPPASCDACHGLQSYKPTLYDPAQHKKYPLAGAHAAVACTACHRTDSSLLAKAGPTKAFLKTRKRSDEFCLTRFRLAGNMQRCDTCHADVHRGQFASRVKQSGCADCHAIESFSQVRFDHARESSFPLTGAHERAACAACHVADASGVVRFKGVGTECASCHADPHAGQFAPAPGRASDCARCHSAASWKPSSFVHRAPFTKFELDGKHAALACTACHRDVTVASFVTARQYRGVPTTCAGCHVDVHRGAFREFKP